MAITTTIYQLFKRNGILPNALDGHTLKVSLHTSSYTPDLAADEVLGDLSGELAASGGYTTGGATIAGLASGVDATGFAYLDGDDVTWAALTPSAPFRYAVVRDVTDSDRLILLIDFGADRDPGGIDFVIPWPAASAGGILKVV
jgi:hypothetical protein